MARTTLRSSKGKKLYAVRDASGRFKDIQTYERAHRADLARTSGAEKKAAAGATHVLFLGLFYGLGATTLAWVNVGSVVLFAISYGRIELFHEVTFGDTYRSNVDRPPAERTALRTMGGQVEILRVHGFVFFGSANGLLARKAHWAIAKVTDDIGRRFAFNTWLALIHHYLMNRDLFAPSKSVLSTKGGELKVTRVIVGRRPR